MPFDSERLLETCNDLLYHRMTLMMHVFWFTSL